MQESSQRSSNISWFDHVQFACASTQSQFEPRFYEGKSLFSIVPSISKVMKVSHSPCQEWGLKVIYQRYDLMGSRPSDTMSVPKPVRDAAVLERTLRSALESYTFQLRAMTALFRFSGNSGQITQELWPSWRQEEENLSSVTWCLPSRRFRSAICCQILSSSRRIYLRLSLLAQLDMPQRMCPCIKSRPSTSSETTQRSPFSSSSASRGRTQSSSAPATPQRSQVNFKKSSLIPSQDMTYLGLQIQ